MVSRVGWVKTPSLSNYIEGGGGDLFFFRIINGTLLFLQKINLSLLFLRKINWRLSYEKIIRFDFLYEILKKSIFFKKYHKFIKKNYLTTNPM